MNLIVIPVYKEYPDENEIISFNQCLKVLGSHTIKLVVPGGFIGTYYLEAADHLGVNITREYFDEFYFQGIDEYNKLLLSYEFYDRFRQFEYILIYQLDSFVFTDHLQKWVETNYDFIGAPLIRDAHHIATADNLFIGNGGFCIRKIQAFLDAFEYSGNLLSLREIVARYEVFKINKFWKRIPLMLLMLLGYRNSFRYFSRTWKYNEDNFWTSFLVNTPLALNVPPVDVAIRFSFECRPSALFQMNHRQLPFGCHAWAKYEYEIFWSKYIS